MNIIRTFIYMLTGILMASVAHAETKQTSSTVAGFGALSSGGSYTNISSGQSPGGYLQTFSLRPDLDTDGDGLHDEIDHDNDGDLLADIDEITGALFDPVTPTHPNLIDADGDGLNDGEEMIAGTNPGNLDARFDIIQINRTGNSAKVTWTSRGNNERVYVVRAIDDSYAGTPSAVIWSNTVGGGSAPWYETTAAITDPSIKARFYALEVIKP